MRGEDRTLRKPIYRASLLVVNFHSESGVHRIIDTAKALDDDLEVIVVDNSGTFRASANHQSPDIRVIQNPEGNEGFGRAINRAAHAANAPIIVLINPDVTLSGDSDLLPLISRLEREAPDVGSASCLLVDDDGSPAPSFITRSVPSFAKRHLGYLMRPLNVLSNVPRKRNTNTNLGQPESDGSMRRMVLGSYGTFVAFRRSAFLQTGGFDEDFFMYCEDTEFFRLRFSLSWRSVAYYDLRVAHEGKGSDVRGVMRKQNMVSFLLYLRKISVADALVYSVGELALASLLLFRGKHRAEGLDRLGSLSYLPTVILYSFRGEERNQPLRIREVAFATAPSDPASSVDQQFSV